MSPTFFDDFPSFYETSKTSSQPNRLNYRVKALIEDNLELVKEKNILDIASHDGRFSFAAIKFGASHVLGIEGNPNLVKKARENMEKYNIPKSKYDFISADIHQEIQKIQPNTVNTVFCFGFFYHTIHHVYLLDQIRKLKPQNLIIDTNVIISDSTILEISAQGGDDEGSAILSPDTKNNQTLVGIPTKSAVELMLYNMNYSFKHYDWHSQNIDDWDFLGDYKSGRRITLIANPL